MKYQVLNMTDGLLASPKKMSMEEAQRFVEEFRARIRKQGYYLTTECEQITPEEVKLDIIKA